MAKEARHEKEVAERRLYRSRTNKMVSGVCGGIGDYFGVDPTLVRLIWIIFILAGGSGLLAYVIFAIIIPEEPAGSKPASQPPKKNYGWIGLFMILMGIFLLFEKLLGFRGLMILALIFFGFVLLGKSAVSK